MKYFKVVLCIIDTINGNPETVKEISMTDYCGEHTPKVGEEIIIKKEDIHCHVNKIIHNFDDIYSIHEIKLYSFRYTGISPRKNACDS